MLDGSAYADCRSAGPYPGGALDAGVGVGIGVAVGPGVGVGLLVGRGVGVGDGDGDGGQLWRHGLPFVRKSGSRAAPDGG